MIEGPAFSARREPNAICCYADKPWKRTVRKAKEAVMKTMLAIAVATCLCAASDIAHAGGAQGKHSFTRAEILQYSLRNGPATPHPEHLTWRGVGSMRPPANIAYVGVLRPLTRREIGMLFGARTAYVEYRTAYDRTLRLYRALVRAGLFKADARVSSS